MFKSSCYNQINKLYIPRNRVLALVLFGSIIMQFYLMLVKLQYLNFTAVQYSMAFYVGSLI